MQRLEALLAEHEAFPFRQRRGVDQDARKAAAHVAEGLVLEQVVVEDLLHEVTAVEIGEPVGKDALRQEPAPEPANLEILVQLRAYRLGVPAAAVAAVEAEVRGRKR